MVEDLLKFVQFNFKLTLPFLFIGDVISEKLFSFPLELHFSNIFISWFIPYLVIGYFENVNIVANKVLI